MSMSMSNINEISWHLVILGLELYCTWKDMIQVWQVYLPLLHYTNVVRFD